MCFSSCPLFYMLLNTDHYLWSSSWIISWNCTCNTLNLSSVCVHCCLTYIPYAFVQWTNQKMFLICSPPPPTFLLSPPAPLCFHFSSQEVIYCQTHSTSQPQLHTLIYPNRLMRFHFPLFLACFLLLTWWNIVAWTLCFYRLISLSRRLWSAEQFYLFWPVCGCVDYLLFHRTWLRFSLFVPFFSLVQQGLHRLDV